MYSGEKAVGSIPAVVRHIFQLARGGHKQTYTTYSNKSNTT